MHNRKRKVSARLFVGVWQLASTVEAVATVLNLSVERVMKLERRLRGAGVQLRHMTHAPASAHRGALALSPSTN